MISPCLRNNSRSPVAKTSAAEGVAPSASRKRSTTPPSKSTQVNSGVATHFWHSRSSRQVCSAFLMFRANRMTPAGCSRVSRELMRGVISVPSKPTIRSCPTLFLLVQARALTPDLAEPNHSAITQRIMITPSRWMIRRALAICSQPTDAVRFRIRRCGLHPDQGKSRSQPLSFQNIAPKQPSAIARYWASAEVTPNEMVDLSDEKQHHTR